MRIRLFFLFFFSFFSKFYSCWCSEICCLLFFKSILINYQVYLNMINLLKLILNSKIYSLHFFSIMKLILIVNGIRKIVGSIFQILKQSLIFFQNIQIFEFFNVLSTPPSLGHQKMFWEMQEKIFVWNIICSNTEWFNFIHSHFKKKWPCVLLVVLFLISYSPTLHDGVYETKAKSPKPS